MIDITYELFLAMLGFGVIAVALAPALSLLLKLSLPLSAPIGCLIGGIAIGLATNFPRIDVIADGPIIQRVAEMAVILSLTGCGLKLDRPFSFRAWGSVWRLLGITMPLSIALTALAGWGMVGLPAAAALLFAASLAPTDPVLAASVQVGPPGEGEEEETRFALTAEAGLNDGLAFPFVYLAIAAAVAAAAAGAANGDSGLLTWAEAGKWLAVDVLWRTLCGVAVGWLIGAGLGWIVFRLAPSRGVADAFLAIGLTLFAYGAAEMAEGYGFIAVFVAALTFRRSEHGDKFHGELHHFIDQTEALMLIGVVFATGIAIGQGLLSDLTWQAVALAVLILAVIRPLTGWVALAGAGLDREERFAISTLGIRGVGSFYYVAYGLTHAPFSVEVGRQIWMMTGLIVALSVLLHGVTAPKLIERITGEPQGGGGGS